jgi:hypothetical protein
MDIYQTLVSAYNQFLAVFPAPVQWVVTLLLLVAIVSAFINLIRHNVLFLVLLVLLLPFIAPILQRFFLDLYHFFLYLVGQLQATAPRG